MEQDLAELCKEDSVYICATLLNHAAKETSKMEVFTKLY
jgi:hypothetical protein